MVVRLICVINSRILLIYSIHLREFDRSRVRPLMKTKTDSSRKIRKMTAAAVFAALLCVIAPWSVPVGAVPVSLASFAVYLDGLTLGKNAVMSVGCYLLLGGVGMPVFSGFSGGVGAFAGPTGGFLAGYLPAALVCGALSDLTEAKAKGRADRYFGYFASALLSALIVHLCGILWYICLTGVTFTEAAAVCVLPFVLPETAKIAAAVMIAAVIRDRAERK